MKPNGSRKVVIFFFFSFPVPSGYPQNVQALTISSTEIVVTWDPVREIERNGIIGRYEVQFNQSALSEISQVNFMETEATNLMLLLQNLQEFVEYSIAVRAYTSIGAGPFSPAVNNQTFEDGECTCVNQAGS